MFLKGRYRKCASISDVKTRGPVILTIKSVQMMMRPLTLLPFTSFETINNDYKHETQGRVRALSSR